MKIEERGKGEGSGVFVVFVLGDFDFVVWRA